MPSSTFIPYPVPFGGVPETPWSQDQSGIAHMRIHSGRERKGLVLQKSFPPRGLSPTTNMDVHEQGWVERCTAPCRSTLSVLTLGIHMRPKRRFAAPKFTPSPGC